MNKKRFYVIIFFLVLIIIVTIINLILFYNKKNDLLKTQKITTSTDLTYDVNSKNEKEKLKQNYESIISGILNLNGEIEKKYNEIEVKEINDNLKIKNGIYVSKKARDFILKNLKISTNIEYDIDEDGYLYNINENTQNIESTKMNKLINDSRNIIIDYNQYYYCKLGEDISTFNIETTEYLEKFQHGKDIILIFNPIKCEQEYESSNEIINQLINNCQ